MQTAAEVKSSSDDDLAASLQSMALEEANTSEGWQISSNMFDTFIIYWHRLLI
jgi:hypothetical protein